MEYYTKRIRPRLNLSTMKFVCSANLFRSTKGIVCLGIVFGVLLTLSQIQVTLFSDSVDLETPAAAVAATHPQSKSTIYYNAFGVFHILL